MGVAEKVDATGLLWVCEKMMPKSNSRRRRRPRGKASSRVRVVEMRTVAGPSSARAVGVDRRPVHRLIACAARPGCVPAAVTEASLMTDENLSGAELVTVQATRRQVRHPLPGRGLYKLAQHDYEANRADSHRA